jgi:hypothetical protein
MSDPNKLITRRLRAVLDARVERGERADPDGRPSVQAWAHAKGLPYRAVLELAKGRATLLTARQCRILDALGIRLVAD